MRLRGLAVFNKAELPYDSEVLLQGSCSDQSLPVLEPVFKVLHYRDELNSPRYI